MVEFINAKNVEQNTNNIMEKKRIEELKYSQYLEPIFNMWKLALTLNSPAFVKNVNIDFKYEDVAKYDDDTILMGTVFFVIVMEDRQFSIEWGGVTESYNDSESKEKAEKVIALTLRSLLTDEFEDKKYENFWNEIDFEQETWNRKE